MKNINRRFVALSAIIGIISSFLFVLAPLQSASAAFRPVSSGGLTINSIANQRVMTDPITGVRNYMAGMAGDRLTILGSGFASGTIAIRFLGANNPINGLNIDVISDVNLEVTVPTGVTTGLVEVSDGVNTVTSLDAFQIWSARSEGYVMPDGHLNITVSDLKFILDQIKFSEAYANRTAINIATTASASITYPFDLNQCMNASDLLSATNLQQYGITGISNTYLYDAISPWGLREVDGRCNNISIDANGNYVNKDWGVTDKPFTRIEPQSPSANGLYTNAATTIVDPTPRLISNLISDQSDANPAAVSAADDTAGILGNSVTYQNSVNATTGVVNTVLDIPNVTADYNTSAGYNSLFTLFGQFFDHGLDLIPKGDPAYVLIPLQSTDPLYVQGANTNFMILTRGAVGPGGTIPAGESMNITTPFIDQSQSYGSHPSQNFFMREYSFAAGTGLPTDTGRLLDGTDLSYSLVSSPALNATFTATVASAALPSAWVIGGNRSFVNSGTLGTSNGGLPTWRDIKAQSFLLGFRLTDYDANNIPVIATNQFGSFIPCAVAGDSLGFPMMLFKGATSNNYRWVCGNPKAPIATSFDENGETWNSVNTNHNFINDTANNAVPYSGNTKLNADADSVVNSAKGSAMVQGFYDNESLDAHYVAGDGRVNENIGLASLHGVFHGEHNIVLKDIQDLLVKNPLVSKEFFSEWNQLGGTTQSPKWNGIRLYQAARLVMEMEYQHMTFDEFIRRISPSLQPFVAYNPAVDPSITAEFASSVYRLGHSMLNETIARSIPGQYYSASENQDLSLIDAFTSPIAFRTQKPITVLAGQKNSTDQTITYTVLTSAGTVSPAIGNVVSITGFDTATGLNVTNAVVSARTEGSFTIHSRFPGGDQAEASVFTGLTNDAQPVVAHQASDGTYVAVATINDPNGNFTYTPAAATAGVVQGMTAQRGNEIDEFVTDAVRNNLLGLPLDLAALNISRGRDTLLPTLNQFRNYLRTLNLAPVEAYPSWMAYGNKMRHFDSLANFIAAYGTHPTVTSKRVAKIKSYSTSQSSHSITFTTVDPSVGAINVGDVVNVSGLTTTGLNKKWARVSAVNGSTFTIDSTYPSDPSAPATSTLNAFMQPSDASSPLTGIVDSTDIVETGYVTRNTTISERRAAASLLLPSDIKTATMNKIRTGSAPDPIITTTTITYTAVNAFKVGDRVRIRYATPLVFNQVATVVEPTSQTSFTVLLDTNPAVESHFMGGRATLEVQQADAEAFINSTVSPATADACDYPTGPSTCINWATTESGMNYVDLWIGGLAEAPVTQPISPEVLPATFDFVFTSQMLSLMNGDRLYYLSRLAGTNLGDEIAGQKLANIILRNTPDKTGALPNNASAVGSTGGLKATPDFIFGIGDCTIDASTYTIDNPGCPNTFLDATTGTITHTPVVLNTVMVNDESCINGDSFAAHRLQAGGGDDVVWGGKCREFLRGGIGGDMIVGQSGDDIIFGEGGDDVMQGGAGNDFIDSGDNVVTDIADGGSGKDFISAGAGMGVFAFSGEAGDDFVNAGVITPLPFNGGDGNDWVQDGPDGSLLSIPQGDSGPNVQLNQALDGGADVVVGGPGNDITQGGSGNDIFLSGDGIDLMWGDEGFDITSYEYRNPKQEIFADLSVALGNPIGILPDVYFGVEGLSGSSGKDVLASDSGTDITIPNASGTIGSDLIYITTNIAAVRVNQQISGIGIPAHTFVVGLPGLVPGIATPTYAITISNMLTTTFTGASIQLHGWTLSTPEYIDGFSALVSPSLSWNKPVTNVNISSFTNNLATATGNYLVLDRAVGWITEGSTISVGGNILVDSTGAAITVTGVNAEAISLSATPTVLPTVYPAVATFLPSNTFSGGNILLGGAGDDILYSQGSDNVIDGEAYLHTCISVTNSDGSAFVTGADVPCGTSSGYSSLNILNHYAGQGLISPLNMTIVREIKYPTDGSGNSTSCAYTCNTLVYAGAPNQYTVTPMVNPLGEVQYIQVTKPDGVDIVRNVKTIQFGNPGINGLLPMSDIWANLCAVGVSCINLLGNYPPLSNTCLSICPGPNVNSFAPPKVTSILPAGGAAGAVVTITGDNFRTAVNGTRVTFGGIQATNVNVIDTMTLTCVVPVGVVTGRIVVTTIGGNGTSPTTFTVVPAPTITRLSATSGTSGTAVTITGANLTYLIGVDINGVPAIVNTQTATTVGITVSNDATTGPIHVVTSSGTATGANFLVRPSITTLTPSSGRRLSSVTINGTNFTGTRAVTVGGIAVPLADILVISPTAIRVVVPATAVSGRIVVTNAGGTATSGNNFTVVLPPTITSFTPTSGGAGTAVTVTGTALTGASLVKIGNTVTPISAVTGSTSVRFTIPTGTPISAQKISITTPGGTVLSTTNFTVTNPGPAITSFTPTNGGGMATVRITGTNLNGVTAVKFGTTSGGAATGTLATFKVVSSTLIIADVPTTLTAVAHYIYLVNGVGSATSVTTFTKSAGLAGSPTVTSFTPTTGGVGTGVTITVPGTSYLSNLVAVKFNGTTAPFTVTSATTILASVPAGATTGTIQLVYPGSVVANGNSFTVTGTAAAPTVTSFSPNQASIGATITVTGTNLSGATTVTFNGITASFKVISATSMTFVVPVGATTGTLKVVTPGGSVTSTATVSIL